MKKLLLSCLLISSVSFLFSQHLKPYTLVLKSSESIKAMHDLLNSNLKSNDIEIIGSYSPADNKNAMVIVVSSEELKSATNIIGGLTGFAASLRIGLNIEGGHTLVTTTTPKYWGNAYYQENFAKVEALFESFEQKMISAFTASGTYIGTLYGSEDGLSAKDLQKYHYMMGMPYFEDNIVLKEFTSHHAAINKIDQNLSKGINNIDKVFELKIPNKSIVLYGFALGGEQGEKEFLPIIDQGNPKHTAFLPYEVLVVDNMAYMLHGRYRIALSFPDLTMGTFSKIMSTPGNIEELLQQVVE